MNIKIKQLCVSLLDFWSRPFYIGLYAAGTSAALLAAAYIAQYGFGLDPCPLCYYQRIPYAINVVLGLLTMVLATKCAPGARLILYIAALVFFADTVIAAFHTGVEYGWWKGLNTCENVTMPTNASIEEMRRWMMSRNIVRCDVPAFTLFGISMAGYNVLAATGLGIGTLLLLYWGRTDTKCEIKTSSPAQE